MAIRAHLRLLALIYFLSLLLAAMAIMVTASERKSTILAWGQSVSLDDTPPGNSLEAVRFSKSLEYDGIELDVRVTKDGIPVLMHDDVIDDASDGERLVSQHTYEELSRFTLGEWRGKRIRISALAEALDASDLTMVDWKPPLGHEEALRDAINGHRVIVAAYGRERALRIKAIVPDTKVYLKTYEPLEQIDVSHAQGLDGLMVESKYGISSEFLTRVRENNLELATFVHEGRMGPLHLWKQQWQGVDIIITMRPDWARLYPFQ